MGHVEKHSKKSMFNMKFRDLPRKNLKIYLTASGKNKCTICFYTRFTRKSSLVRHRGARCPDQEKVSGKRMQTPSPSPQRAKSTKPSPLTPIQPTIQNFIGQASTSITRHQSASSVGQATVYKVDSKTEGFLNGKYFKYF